MYAFRFVCLCFCGCMYGCVCFVSILWYLCIIVVNILLFAIRWIAIMLFAWIECVNNDLFSSLNFRPTKWTSLNGGKMDESIISLLFDQNRFEWFGNVLFLAHCFRLYIPVLRNPPATQLGMVCTTSGHTVRCECPYRSLHIFCTAEMCYLRISQA